MPTTRTAIDFPDSGRGDDRFHVQSGEPIDRDGHAVGGELVGVQLDPFGQRMAMTANGVTTRSMIDPRDRQPGCDLRRHDRQPDRSLCLRSRPGQPGRSQSHGEVYNLDLTGSTVGMAHATGQYVNRFHYLPFGESTVTAGAANLFMYPGAYGVTPEAAAGLYRTRATTRSWGSSSRTILWDRGRRP